MLFVPAIVAVCAAAAVGAPALRVYADFPGGNIIVESIDGDRIRLRPDLRDTEGFWFYWAFRVRGAAGKTIAIDFLENAKQDVIAARGPAVSLDRGLTWTWMGLHGARRNGFAYSVPAGVEEARFSMNMPYFAADLARFLDRHRANPSLKVTELTRTPKGRTVEKLHAGRLDGNPRFRALLTSRHHACESMGDFALEGILAEVLADTDDGRWLRENVEITAVPFMDKDGVEDGDQGKNRRPHDHNRDYDGEPVYGSVRALKEFVVRWAGGRLRFTLDLHCPYIKSGIHEKIHFVGGPDHEIADAERRFAAILEKIQSRPLVYRTADNLPFGQHWNTMAEPKSFSRWAAMQPGIWFSSTVEIPYANAGGPEVNGDSARAFGRDLARAMRRCFEEGGRPRD